MNATRVTEERLETLPDEPERCALDAIGVRHGTDLSSLGRNCLRSWERFLAPLREQAFDLLEIGVGTGASLRTWRAWFPAARLVGLDARRLALDPPIADCTLVHGSQTDLAVLQPLLRDYRFRFILDDGSRHPDDQVQTFLTLFPWLEPDSLYICAGFAEDTAGLDQPVERAAAQPPQPMAPATQPAGAFRRTAGRKPDPVTGLAWFAELGRGLTASERSTRQARQPALDLCLRKATGVVLMPGSVMVTS